MPWNIYFTILHCGGLDEKDPHRLMYLNALFLVARTLGKHWKVWLCWRRHMYYRGWALFRPSPTLSAFCLRIRM